MASLILNQKAEAEINEVPDTNSDGAISLDDVEHLLKHNKNVAMPLKTAATFAVTSA